MYNEIKGDLIQEAKKGSFDVIAHGCNCFCRMKRGLAPQMAKAFGCDKYIQENSMFEGDINKLGNIDHQMIILEEKLSPQKPFFYVVNCYTQYEWSTETKPFDYEAFTLCMRKMNHIFKDKHIGLPQIGSHLAGGDWERIKMIIQNELRDCDVTIVIYEPE